MAGLVLLTGRGEPRVLTAGSAQTKMQFLKLAGRLFSQTTSKNCIFVEIKTLKIQHKNKLKINVFLKKQKLFFS